MEKIRRHAIALVMCLFLICNLAVINASALEPIKSENIYFDDITGNQYVAEIIQGAEYGIVKGDGQSYYPDRELTVYEMAIMMTRAFLTTDDMTYDEYLYTAVKESWISSGYITSPDITANGFVIRGAFYDRLFSAAQVGVWDASWYDENLMSGPWISATYAAAEFGLCDVNAGFSEKITRGEAIYAIVNVLNHEYVQTVPEFAQTLPVSVNSGSFAKWQEALKWMTVIPEDFLNQFIDCGWHIVFGTERLDEYNRTYNVQAVGLCEYNTKTLYVAESGSLLHEFGHAVDGLTNYRFRSTGLFEKEAAYATGVLRDYAATSAAEYFADVFAYWVRNQNNAENLKYLQEAAPETYDYFLQLMQF